MMASKIAKKHTPEELKALMEEPGYTAKTFKNSQHYRGWYYRNRKKMFISGVWHIDEPMTFYYKPISELEAIDAQLSEES